MKQVLVILTCLSVLIWTVFGAPTSIRKSCCRRYGSRLPHLDNITKYEIQINDGRCRKNAVLFFVNEKSICADPAKRKVKTLVKKLSQREERG